MLPFLGWWDPGPLSGNRSREDNLFEAASKGGRWCNRNLARAEGRLGAPDGGGAGGGDHGRGGRAVDGHLWKSPQCWEKCSAIGYNSKLVCYQFSPILTHGWILWRTYKSKEICYHNGNFKCLIIQEELHIICMTEQCKPWWTVYYTVCKLWCRNKQ